MLELTGQDDGQGYSVTQETEKLMRSVSNSASNGMNTTTQSKTETDSAEYKIDPSIMHSPSAKSDEMVGAAGKNSKGLRLLPDVEYNERRRKGICFTCEEKYSPEHIFKNEHIR